MIVPVCAVLKKVASIKGKEGLEMTKKSSRCQRHGELGERCRRERGTELRRKEGGKERRRVEVVL